MKILLAHSDRDLLQSCATLFRLDGWEVRTAFDGTGAAALLAEGPYDAVAFEERLPRVGGERLLRLFEREGAPSVALLDRRVNVERLLRAQLPSAYLSLPFLPGELRELIARVADMARSDERLACGPLTVEVSAFRFAGTGVRLTAGEIDLLRALGEGRPVGGRRAWTTILALNEKMKALGSPARIAYEREYGYRLVSEHD